MRFYISLLTSVIILSFAIGATSGITLAELAKRTAIGLILGFLAWAALFKADLSKASLLKAARPYLARLDRFFAEWGFEPKAGTAPEEDRSCGLIAASAVIFVLFMLAYNLAFPFVTQGYVKYSRLSDKKLLALATADKYNHDELSEKYRLSFDPGKLDHTTVEAVSRLRSPESLRQAALELGKDYKPAADDLRSKAFLTALDRLRAMKRQDHISRVYYGLLEYGKDRSMIPPMGALLRVVERIDDKDFLKTIVQDAAAPPEVKRAAEEKLGDM